MMQKMVENYGCNNLIDDLRSERVTFDKAVGEAIQVWLSAVQQTASRPRTEGIIGAISAEEFQGVFRAVSEKITALAIRLQ